MNPTTTEHDFRFPRRPVDARTEPIKAERDGSSPSSNNKTNAGDLRADLRELTLDLTIPSSQNQKGLPRSTVFQPFQNGIFSDDSDHSPEELQKEDPLAAQVWRFFSKTKQMLPNQERMENLTWRMMHLNLRKRRQQEEQAR
jgi:GATA-binding protein